MPSTIEVVGGYAVVIAIGGAFYVYYSRSARAGRARDAIKRATPATVTDATEKVEKKVRGAQQSVKNKATQRKKDASRSGASQRGQSSVGAEGKSSTFETNGSSNAKSRGAASADDADDRAFAAQFAKTQQGTTLKAPEKNSSKVKTTKQGKANQVADELASATESSNAPSTSGADADDDLSSHASPQLKAATLNGVPTGVEDMIEPSAPGPAALRITAPSEQRPQKPKPVKKEQEVETKKQRQRRKKNEERKAQAAEDEKQRRVLQERQMKAARTADGTAKTHISKFTAPTSNAWNSANESSTSANQESNAVQAELLDTFEPTPSSEQKTPMNGTTPINGSLSKPLNGTSDHSVGGLSSSIDGEWEQVPSSVQDDTAWDTAESKKSKKNKKKAAATADSS